MSFKFLIQKNTFFQYKINSTTKKWGFKYNITLIQIAYKNQSWNQNFFCGQNCRKCFSPKMGINSNIIVCFLMIECQPKYWWIFYNLLRAWLQKVVINSYFPILFWSEITRFWFGMKRRWRGGGIIVIKRRLFRLGEMGKGGSLSFWNEMIAWVFFPLDISQILLLKYKNYNRTKKVIYKLIDPFNFILTYKSIIDFLKIICMKKIKDIDQLKLVCM